MINFKKTDAAKLLEQQLNISFTPARADEGSNGYDLRAAIDAPKKLWPGEVYKFPTGVHIWLGSDKTPTLYLHLAGLLLPRSSSPGLILTNTVGLLDKSYQGEIFFKYRNITEESIEILPGEKIGQLLITSSFIFTLNEVPAFFEETSRAEGGFGSSGRI